MDETNVAAEAGSTFWYLVPSPDTRLITRILAAQVVYLAFLAVIVLSLGVFPYWIVVAFCVAWVTIVTGTVLLTILMFKRSRVSVSASGLVFETILSRKKVDWNEVESIGFEELKLRFPFERLLRGDIGAARVKVLFRRGRLLLTVPGTRFLSLYLGEPERFVEEAQRYLTPAVG